MSRKFKNNQSSQSKARTMAASVQAKFLEAYSLHMKGQLGAAQVLYEEVLKVQANHVDCLHFLGIAAYQTQNFARAAELIRRAISLHPHSATLHSNLGLALKELGQLDLAVSSFSQAIALKPDYAEAHNNLGGLLINLRQLDAAVASFDKAIAAKPDYAEAYFNRGLALGPLDQLEAAIASFDKAIEIRPDYADAYYNRGIALRDLMQLEAAVASFDQAIAANPRHIQAWDNRGSTLADLKQLSAAVASYDMAIAIEPRLASVHYNRGIALHGLKDSEAAVASFNAAVAIDPAHAHAYNNLGLVQIDLGDFEAAVASFDKAIAVMPGYTFAYNNRGTALNSLKRFKDAIASYDTALRIDPQYAKTHYNRGLALYGLKQLSAAIDSYDKAIAIQPGLAEAHNNRGNALLELRRPDAAASAFESALAIRPDYEFLVGTLVFTRMLQCNWEHFDHDVARLASGIRLAQKVSTPFPLLALVDAPDLHKLAAQTQVAALYPPATQQATAAPVPQTGEFQHGKIRIGYYSGDFRNHPVSYLLVGLLEAHDKSRFELIGFSFGPPIHDDMRQRVAAAFDRFIDVGDLSDKEVAKLSRNMQIDIAVDLMGFTQDSRLGVFAERCAPIQINYLGYPGTTGAPYMDYVVADAVVIPAESRHHYTEKVAYLPHCYLVNDAKRSVSDKVFSREELGLPEAGFVFCCFNNTFKITPGTFDSWMRILSRVEGSVLWLRDDGTDAMNNLRKEAQKRNVDSSRLVFAGRVPLVSDHLARHKCADLFLDTLPYNAHTTAADALWTGLPILTLKGRSFASRVASSLLQAIGLPELITHTPEEFETLAVELATQPLKLERIKHVLNVNKLTCPLFDTQRYTHDLENLFVAMVQRHRSGAQPEHFI